jgi:hypothetical protein
MAMQSVFYDTLLPEGVINLMEEDLKVFDNNLEDSRVGGGNGSIAGGGGSHFGPGNCTLGGVGAVIIYY